MKKLMENWRKFLNEEQEDFFFTDEISNTKINKEINLLSKDLEFYVTPAFYNLEKVYNDLYTPVIDDILGPFSFDNVKNIAYAFPKDVFQFITSKSDFLQKSLEPKMIKKNYYFSNEEIGNKGINLFDFWRKPAGIDVKSFLAKQLKVLHDNKETKKQRQLSQREENVFYHTSNQNLQVGDIIKPYWTEENVSGKQGAGGMIGAADLANAVEEEFEKYRPKDKPSRRNALYAWKNIEDVYKHDSKSSRKIYKIVPLSGAKINIGSYNALPQVATVGQTETDYGDPEETEQMDNEKDEDIKKIIFNYWHGKDTEALEVVIGPPGAKVVGIVE